MRLSLSLMMKIYILHYVTCFLSSIVKWNFLAHSILCDSFFFSSFCRIRKCYRIWNISPLAWVAWRFYPIRKLRWACVWSSYMYIHPHTQFLILLGLSPGLRFFFVCFAKLFFPILRHLIIALVQLFLRAPLF